MFCPGCGSEVAEGAKFCSNCGKTLARSGSSVEGTIQLRCKSCNGIMNVKDGESILYCPYCGAEEMMLDSEDVAREKIRYKAYADVEKHKHDTTRQVEMARLKHEREMAEHEEIKESSREFKKSRLRKWVIVFAIICAVITYSRISDKDFRGALIPGAQTILFLASWILGMGTSKKHWLHRIFALAGFALIIPFIQYGAGSGGIARTPSKLEWPSTGLAAKLPTPDSEYGEIVTNYNNLLRADVERFSGEKYEDYISQCQEMGFTVEENTTSTGYDAFNAEGYDLSLSYYDWNEGEMNITLRAPIEMTQITWPVSGPAALLPVPGSSTGKIESDSSDHFSAYIGGISKEEFSQYVVQCKEKGFTVNYSNKDEEYTAENIDGYQLDVEYRGFNIMKVEIEEPETRAAGQDDPSDVSATGDLSESITGNESDPASAITSAPSGYETTARTPVNTDAAVTAGTPANTDAAVTAETPAGTGAASTAAAPADGGAATAAGAPLTQKNVPAEETASGAQGIRQEFREYVDSYEAFYNEYVDFMTNYDSTDLSMLAQYADLMAKAEEFDRKAEAYEDDGDLTPEELKYLWDAELRIEQKLLSIE